MKTLSLCCGMIMLIATAVIAAPRNNHAKTTKRQATATITLSSVAIHVPTAGYHIVLTPANNPSKHYTAGFPVNGGSTTTTVPAGIYTASIIPTGGAGSTHHFHALDCANTYDKTGVSAAWSGLDFTCGSGSFSIN